MRLTMMVAAAAVIGASCAAAQTPAVFRQDVDTALEAIASTYAYADTKATRWGEVPALYREEVRGIRSRNDLIAVLERIVEEWYDPHMQLTANLARSTRLVPSGTDLWATWQDGQAAITQVRDRSDAARAGLRAGAIVITLDGVPIADAVEARLGRSYPHSTTAARDWALRAVLAGRHDTPRRLQVRQGGELRTVTLPAADQFTGDRSPLEASEIRPGIGYIRVNNSLGDGALVAAFDSALSALRGTRGLIVDLRDTPSGGNTTVARGILGRFVARELPYQRHELPSEERATGVRRSWQELVSPRGPWRYDRPVAVLVGRWTGSMGEGLAIGFDGTGAATVVGTPMAGLVGATTSLRLPRSDIGVNIPAERLYHVNGTPREAWTPPVPVDVARAGPADDPILDAALGVLSKR